MINVISLLPYCSHPVDLTQPPVSAGVRLFIIQSAKLLGFAMRVLSCSYYLYGGSPQEWRFPKFLFSFFGCVIHVTLRACSKWNKKAAPKGGYLVGGFWDQFRLLSAVRQ